VSGRERGHRNRISTAVPTQSETHAHHPKRNARSHLITNRRRQTVPLICDVLAKNRLNRNKSSREQMVKKGKAKRTSTTSNGPICTGRHSVVAAYVQGVTNRADKPSRTLTTRNNWTIRGENPREVWHRMGLRPTIDAFADDHNHHLSLYWTYFPSPHASGTNAVARVCHRHQLLHINP